jgi:hypothetical protein
MWPRFLAFLVATVAAAICIYFDLSKAVLVIGLVLALTPVIVLDLVSPPPLDFAGTRSGIEFDFRDPGYAAEFALLNGTLPEGAKVAS